LVQKRKNYKIDIENEKNFFLAYNYCKDFDNIDNLLNQCRVKELFLNIDNNTDILYALKVFIFNYKATNIDNENVLYEYFEKNNFDINKLDKEDIKIGYKSKNSNLRFEFNEKNECCKEALDDEDEKIRFLAHLKSGFNYGSLLKKDKNENINILNELTDKKKLNYYNHFFGTNYTELKTVKRTLRSIDDIALSKPYEIQSNYK
jgi:hypothetical protein